MLLPKAVLAVAALAISPASAIWPVPKSISTGNLTLSIDQTLVVTYNGEPVRISSLDYLMTPRREYLAETRLFDQTQQLSYAKGYSPPAGADFKSKDIVQGGLERALSAIFQQGLVPWMLRARGSNFDPNLDRAGRVSKLAITQTEKDTKETFRAVAGSVDESYSLTVSTEGEAAIEAASSIGVLRALETFTQLFYQHSNGQAWYTQLAPVKIKDEPKFPYRGVHLDVARHWFEIEDIKRTIDGLSMNKLNVLHLHITDTQSWPLEIPALPKLTEKGAYAKGLTYSPDEIADLYEYAVHRGVQIIMEIDMPGHVGIEEAYPGLTVAFDKQPYQFYCAQPPCGSFKLNDTKVEDFLDTLFDDLLPRIAPYSAYFHTGGDEYKPNNSLIDPALETNDVAVLQPMLQRFLSHAHDKVVEHGLLPMVWEEMVLEWNATVPKDTIIQTWLGEAAVGELAEAGHKVIDSNNAFYYLDCGRGQWLDFDNGKTWQALYPFNDWCSPTKSWRLIYSHEPTDNVPEEAQKNVLGGELPVWTETIDTTSLDSLMWPRAGAAAEVWWSGRTDAQGKNRTLLNARPRLGEQRERMLQRGIRGTPITQLWCEMNDVSRCQHDEQ
jgi:hexosaminidase